MPKEDEPKGLIAPLKEQAWRVDVEVDRVQVAWMG